MQGDEEPQPVPRRSVESAPTAATAVSPPSGTSATSATSVGTPYSSWSSSSARSSASAPEPREVSGTPEGTPDPSGSWRKVTKAPPAVTDPTPLMDAAIPDPPPPIPLWVKIAGLGGVAVLLVLSLWLGLTLGAPGPTASPSTKPSPSATWELAAPQQVGDFVQGEVSESMDPAIEERRIITSGYSDGTDRIVVVLSRPEPDIRTYLANAAISDVTEVGEASCGTSSDTGAPVCVRIVDDSAVMVLGLTEQSHTVLAGNVEAFIQALTA